MFYALQRKENRGWLSNCIRWPGKTQRIVRRAGPSALFATSLIPMDLILEDKEITDEEHCPHGSITAVQENPANLGRSLKKPMYSREE
ncbi:hypothetical protein OIU74_018199 [Salix koriyanagi]|uniref:Uncharacterized protein n=1 Tax=Salix koriyanagi TaxID=2511006 RepID=A0A9Q0WR24_9ROSI|nr:hypothetical protein OIU74_018199 [Salix koriyanagi]